jgi:hypothetical protein
MKFFVLPVLISTAIFFGCPNDTIENLSSNAIIGNKQGKSEDMEPTIFEVEAELVELKRVPFLSASQPYQITMKQLDENVVFNCGVDNGYFLPFFAEPVETRNLSAHSGDSMLWMNYKTKFNGQIEHDFIEVVIKSEENIIGYAVIEINRVKQHSYYNAVVLKSVLFPQVDGEYQHISEEYVEAAIERIKGETNGDDL